MQPEGNRSIWTGGGRGAGRRKGEIGARRDGTEAGKDGTEVETGAPTEIGTDTAAATPTTEIHAGVLRLLHAIAGKLEIGLLLNEVDPPNACDVVMKTIGTIVGRLLYLTCSRASHHFESRDTRYKANMR